jgi:hypothetical protein
MGFFLLLDGGVWGDLMSMWLIIMTCIKKDGF